MVAPSWANATTYPQFAQVRSNGQVYCLQNGPNTASPTSEPGVGAQWANYWTKVFNVTDVLDNFATEYPQWAAQGFEIAGFCWFHGWNDGLSYTGQYAYRYEQNMAQFIRKIREYYVARYPGKNQNQSPVRHRHRRLRGIGRHLQQQLPHPQSRLQRPARRQ